MWGALKSDLHEFVSSVKDETADVLTQIDTNFPDVGGGGGGAAAAAAGGSGGDNGVNASLDSQESSEYASTVTPAEEEAYRRMTLHETYTTPLLPSATSKAEKKKEDGVDDEDDDNNNNEDDDDLDDLDEEEKDEITTFLASFKVDAKTNEISQLLEEYQDTLKPTFEALVPTIITYEQFWTCYFYRCDPERINQQWTRDEELRRRQRAEALSQGVTTVKNFLGGAVKAVASTAETVAHSTTASGRPPFVMNTAVDEDDDEEEELGWDDDEDDLDDVDDDVNESAGGVVEFQDPVSEQLKAQLQQAITERDQLHQTVEMQTQEIATLKAVVATSSSTTSGTDSPAAATTASSEEFEQLKMQLFEKEAELAAVKASLDEQQKSAGTTTNEPDANEERIRKLELDNEQLTEEVRAKTTEVQDTHALLREMKDEMQAAVARSEQQQDRFDEILEQNTALEVQVVELKDQQRSAASASAASDSEEKEQLLQQINALQGALEETKQANTTLQSNLDTLQEQHVTETSRAQQTLAGSQQEVATIQTELTSTRSKLTQAQKQIEQLEQQLADARQRQQQQHGDTDEGNASPAEISTASSGVKVEPPTPTTSPPPQPPSSTNAASAAESQDDGWGDDDW